MKRIIALFVLLLLIGCSAPKPVEQLNETPIVAPSETVVVAEPDSGADERAEKQERKQVLDDSLKEKVIQEQEKRIVEAVQNPPPLPQRNRTTVAGEMWKTFSGIDSYKFKTFTGAYYVRGDKVRIVLRSPITKRGVTQNGKNYPEIIVDEVILDRTARSAIGYCFGITEQTRNNCANLELSDSTGFSLPYEEFAIKMPEDWVKEYMTEKVTEEESQKYFLGTIETTKVKFNDGVEMYFYPKAGLPIKIIKGPQEMIVFDSLIPNQARPEDVIHRARNSIPPTELFYAQIY